MVIKIGNKKIILRRKRHKFIIQVLKGEKGKWYWRIKNVNGHVLATSEMYSSRYKAKQTSKNLFNSFKATDCIYAVSFTVSDCIKKYACGLKKIGRTYYD